MKKPQVRSTGGAHLDAYERAKERKRRGLVSFTRPERDAEVRHGALRDAWFNRSGDLHELDAIEIRRKKQGKKTMAPPIR